MGERQGRDEIIFSPEETGVPNENFMKSFPVNSCNFSPLGLHYFRN